MNPVTAVIIATIVTCLAIIAVEAIHAWLDRRDTRRLEADDERADAASRVDDDCAVSLASVQRLAQLQRFIDANEVKAA